MKLSKLSNQTNSQDPQAVNSRVFVGNLNTFQCSKTDVERMFQKYGRLAGISMHKGYAFVQFLNPYDARNACHGEDGRNILSQVLDVNMVAEPKAHQIGRNRQNVTKTGNDWDYYYDSYCTSTMFPSQSPRPIKRQRLMTPQTRGNGLVNAKVNVGQQQMMLSTSPPLSGGGQHHHQTSNNGGHQTHHLHQQQQHQQQQQQQRDVLHGNGGVYGTAASHMSALGPMVVSMMQNMVNNNGGNGPNGPNGSLVAAELLAQQSAAAFGVGATFGSSNGIGQPSPSSHLLGPFKVYSNPDTLICGNCRECFAELGDLLDHKRAYCKLRFTCKCQEAAAFQTSNVSRRPSTTPSPPATATRTPVATHAASPPPPQPQAMSATTPTGRLVCALCKGDFAGPWELMVHVQTTHMINIYELNNSSSNSSNVGPAATIPTQQQTTGSSIIGTAVNAAAAAAATTSGSDDVVVAATAANDDALQSTNIESIIGLDADAVSAHLHQHNDGRSSSNNSSSSSSSNSLGGRTADGDDIDLSDVAMLSPTDSSASIKDDVLLFNISTPSPPQRQHLNASPPPPTHLSLLAMDGGHLKRNGSTYSSRHSSPRPESASPTNEHDADENSRCIMRTLSIDANPTSTTLGIVTSTLALTIAKGGSTITTQ